MGTSDVFFLLSLGLHLVVIGRLVASAATEHQSATSYYVVYLAAHVFLLFVFNVFRFFKVIRDFGEIRVGFLNDGTVLLL